MPEPKYNRKLSDDDEHVKKIDDDGRFNAIKTGLKTMTSLKKHERERLSVWYNYYKEHKDLGVRVPKNKSSIGWVADYHATIKEYIEATYQPPAYKPATTRNHLEGLANVLLAIDKNKYRETVREFFVTGLGLQRDIDDKREDNELTEAERANFVVYEEVVRERDRLYEEWMKKPKDKRLNIYHMVLAVNSYIPPLRLQMVDMEIWKQKKAPPDNVEQNYLWEKSPGQWSIVINHDKIEYRRVAKGLKREIFDLSDDIPGVTNGAKLNNIITESLKHFKRDYLVVGIRTGGEQGMSKSSYDQAFASIFRPKKPTQNVMRKMYINYWHSQNLSSKILKEIARRQRHTLQVAMTAYKKVNIGVVDPIVGLKVIQYKDIPDPTKEPDPVKVDHNDRKQRGDYFNPSKYMKEYRLKNKEKLQKARKADYEDDDKKYKILRAKILRNWNLGVMEQKKPRQSTLDKYEIVHNKKTKRWE